MTRPDRLEAAKKYLAGRKSLRRFDLWEGLIWRFGLQHRDAELMLFKRRLELGEITAADLTQEMRRKLIDPENLDLHAIAAGPIMNSNELFLPAGKISLAEAKAREQAGILAA